MATSDPPAPDTFFAPAGRAEETTLRAQIQACMNSPLTRVILESLGGYVMVLNDQRQILAANGTLLEALRQEGMDGSILGMRWGEAAGCVHAPDGPGGCGTSKACSCCGAAIGILLTLEEGRGQEAECRMSTRRQGVWEARDYQISSTPVDLPCGRLVVLVFHDISGQKRREVLESTFLHDLANTLQALSTFSEVMQIRAKDPAEAARRILALSVRLSEAVDHQRLLLQAESGALMVVPQIIDIRPYLASLAETLLSHPAAKGQRVTVDPVPRDVASTRTDPGILFRILLNMGINALEATQAGDEVRVGFGMEDGLPTFSVRNPGVVPPQAALQIFHRSFSTKARSGRGIGTHAMKLLGENYLGGRVGFRSSEGEGTVFFLRLPLPAPATAF
jgi:hypothetical protein